MTTAISKELQRIPGVGPSIAEDLQMLGFRAVEELRGQDPELLYERLCELQGVRIDRCMLYVLRCAVYFASEEEHDPELLKWWSWKDGAEGRYV
ncbi:MAG TPA: helix-hairpin-helix domain-containing protein [Longimicrobiaceae bacterium]|nr:helix-hairpin-helix domain-containing protein [Longimicrobiaceae bacterium]